MYNISKSEFVVLTLLLPLICSMSGAPLTVMGLQKAVVSTMLTVDPTAYIYSFESLSGPIKIFLKRFVQIVEMLKNPHEYLPSKACTDVFESNEIQDGYNAVVYRNGERVVVENTGGSLLSWVYHMLINGLVHPTTREEIVSLVGFGNPLENPTDELIQYTEFLGLDKSFLTARHLYGLPEIFSHSISQNFYQDLFEPLKDQPNLSVFEMIAFEQIYSVPHDRQFTRMISGYEQ